MKTDAKLFHVSCQILLLGRKATIRNKNGRKPAHMVFSVVTFSVAFYFQQQFERMIFLPVCLFTTETLSYSGCGLLGLDCSTVRLPLALDTALFAAA